jgi:hypothetical protein
MARAVRTILERRLYGSSFADVVGVAATILLIGFICLPLEVAAAGSRALLTPGAKYTKGSFFICPWIEFVVVIIAAAVILTAHTPIRTLKAHRSISDM